MPADARGDFEHATGTVTFVPGDPLQATIEVNTCDDETTEGDGTVGRGGIVEAFTLNARFTDLVNIGAADAVDAAATVQILDNDPLPALTIEDHEVHEGEDLVTAAQAQHAAAIINHQRRRSLHHQSPAELYAALTVQ